MELIGRLLPDVWLPSTFGTTVNPCAVKGRAIYFCYPYTGKPQVPDPENWDHIKGAHGSTPQALGFAKLHDKFTAHGVSVFGLSVLSADWNLEFATRNSIPFELLSDEQGYFSHALSLPRFWAGDRQFLARISLICNNAMIETVIYPIENPAANAADCLNAMGLA
jgi:peroxiredoxin